MRKTNIEKIKVKVDDTYKIIQEFAITKDDKVRFFVGDKQMEVDMFDTLRYTGLNINGVDVFEGDVLKLKGSLGIVRFYPGYNLFLAVFPNWSVKLVGPDSKFDDAFAMEEVEDYDVIVESITNLMYEDVFGRHMYHLVNGELVNDEQELQLGFLKPAEFNVVVTTETSDDLNGKPAFAVATIFKDGKLFRPPGLDEDQLIASTSKDVHPHANYVITLDTIGRALKEIAKDSVNANVTITISDVGLSSFINLQELFRTARNKNLQVYRNGKAGLINGAQEWAIIHSQIKYLGNISFKYTNLSTTELFINDKVRRGVLNGKIRI